MSNESAAGGDTDQAVAEDGKPGCPVIVGGPKHAHAFRCGRGSTECSVHGPFATAEQTDRLAEAIGRAERAEDQNARYREFVRAYDAMNGAFTQRTAVEWAALSERLDAARAALGDTT